MSGGASIKKVKAVTDYSRVYTTKAGAESGKYDHVNEIDINTDAFETGDLYAEKDGDFVKLYKKGENGEIGMAWMPIEAVDFEDDSSLTPEQRAQRKAEAKAKIDEINKKREDMLDTRSDVEKQMERWSQTHNKNESQISSREGGNSFNQNNTQTSQNTTNASVIDHRSDVEKQMEQWSKTHNKNESQIGSAESGNSLSKKILNAAIDKANGLTGGLSTIQDQSGDKKSETTSDSKDINTTSSISNVNVQKTSTGYQAMYMENGKLVTREYDIFGRETINSRISSKDTTPNEVNSAVNEKIKIDNLSNVQTNSKNQSNEFTSKLGSTILSGAKQVIQRVKDTTDKQVQDAAVSLQAGKIGNLNSYNPQNMQHVKNKIDVSDLPHEFNKQTLDRIKKLKEQTGAKFGLDIAHYQHYPIDYNAVKAAGIDYVSIQWGGRGSSGNKYIDGDLDEETIRKNVHDALEAGLEVGIYTWGQPVNESEAKEEAKWTVEFLNSLPKKDRDRLTIPVMYDYESFSGRSEGISKQQHTANINAFNKVMAENGYKTLTYAARTHYGNYINGSDLVSDTNNLWVAEYGANNGYDGAYNIWQYGSDGVVDGINGRVDLNVYYENPSVKKQDATSDSKDIKSSSISNVNVQKTATGYQAMYMENGKLVTREYDSFGRETINSRMSSKNNAPNQVNVAVSDAIKSTNAKNAQVSNTNKSNQKANAFSNLILTGINQPAQMVQNKVAESYKNKENEQTVSKNNAFASAIAASANQVAGFMKDTAANQIKTETQRLQAAEIQNTLSNYKDIGKDNYVAIADVSTNLGVVVASNKDGDNSRLYIYNDDGSLNGTLKLETKSKITSINYNKGDNTVKVQTSDGKTNTYKMTDMVNSINTSKIAGKGNVASLTKNENFQTAEFNKIPDNGSSIAVPYFSQNDPTWSGVSYWGGNLGSDGCGITSPSMAISYVLGGSDSGKWVYPPDVLETIAKHNGGNVNTNAGVGGALMPMLGEYYNLNVKSISPGDMKSLVKELKKGHPIVASYNNDHFGNHFICITGFKTDSKGNVVKDGDGNPIFTVNDPNANHTGYSYQNQDYATINQLHGGAWSFSKK